MSGVRLNDGPDIRLFISVGWGRSFFVYCLAHRGSTVGFLLLQCSSGVVRHPGIARYRSQNVVSVEFSSLFHHSICLWFICFPWWSIDDLGNLHADRTTVSFEPWQKLRARLGSRKTALRSPPLYLNTDRSEAVLLLWFLTVTCSCCQYLYFDSPIMLVIYFSKC